MIGTATVNQEISIALGNRNAYLLSDINRLDENLPEDGKMKGGGSSPAFC